MKHFVVQDINTYDLLKPLNEMLDSGTLQWTQNQISLTNPKGHDDHTFGVGSLYLDYENSHRHVNDAGNEEIRVPRFENPLQEKDLSFIKIFKFRSLTDTPLHSFRKFSLQVNENSEGTGLIIL